VCVFWSNGAIRGCGPVVKETGKRGHKRRMTKRRMMEMMPFDLIVPNLLLVYYVMEAI
jgi:hypothetical protein